jgi:ribonuclease-3
MVMKILLTHFIGSDRAASFRNSMNSLAYTRRQKQLSQFIQRLGISEEAPLQWTLLDLALTHATFSKVANYEQLEFVGDAVVKLAAAEFLLSTYPHQTAGEMTAIRSILVSDRILAQVADSYNWGQYLLVGNSALGDRAGQESRLAASFEAVLAALYLSSHDMTFVSPWLYPHFERLSEEIRQDPAFHNYKGALQEQSSALFKTLPEYRVQEIGQRHGDEHRFSAEVWINQELYGSGTGPSKKAAEQAAAQAAFLKLREQRQAQANAHAQPNPQTQPKP